MLHFLLNIVLGILLATDGHCYYLLICPMKVRSDVVCNFIFIIAIVCWQDYLCHPNSKCLLLGVGVRTLRWSNCAHFSYTQEARNYMSEDYIICTIHENENLR